MSEPDFVTTKTAEETHEATKGAAGMVMPSAAKTPAPFTLPTEAARQGRTEELQRASENRQQARADTERKAAADKAGKVETVFKAVKTLSGRGTINAHAVWRFISLNGITPRPGSEDEFLSLLIEMAHTSRLEISGGNFQSPLTKLFVKPQEFRID